MHSQELFLAAKHILKKVNSDESRLAIWLINGALDALAKEMAVLESEILAQLEKKTNEKTDQHSG